MQLAKYDPLHELEKMERNVDKVWDDWEILPAFTESSAVDLYEEDGRLIAQVELPGFTKEEIKIIVDNRMLELSAEHKEEEEKTSNRRYYLRESSSRFFRRVTLPEGVEADKADASFHDGVLKIMMPITKRGDATEVAIK